MAISATTTKQTIQLDLDGGPLVADIYPAAGDATPILLVHGWGGSGRYWAQTVAHLRDQFTLIVPDLPGIGRAMPVQRAWDMFAQAEALAVLLKHLGIGRAHVVGHSMGSGITILLAAKRPDLIERLVLTSITLFETDAQRHMFERVVDSAEVMMRLRGTWMADVPGLVRQAARPFFARVPNQPELLRAAFYDYLTMDRATAIASARNATSTQITDAAANIEAPTLLVIGRQDRYMPHENAPATVRRIPDCTMRWIENCGHLPMVEAPDEYARLLRSFLAQKATVGVQDSTC